MEDNTQYTPEKLEQLSYRFLQQTAKKMGLPSNVKKMHLINLICAKKFKSPQEVEAIVFRVKLERQRVAQVRKNRKGRRRMRLQGTEISSTSTSYSPPISITPKSHLAIRYSPQHRKLIRYKPKTSLLNCNRSPNPIALPSMTKPNASDRVLRSFNMKTSKYGILNMNNAITGVIKAPNRMASEDTTINIVGLDGRYQKLNVTAIVRKRSNNDLEERHLVHASTSMATSPPPKRKRTLSGIYPLKDATKPNQCVSSLVRKTDGRLAKINTYIHRPKIEEKHNDLTIQDIIDCNVTQSLNNKYFIKNNAHCAKSVSGRFLMENNALCAKSVSGRYLMENNAQCANSVCDRYLLENNAQCAKSISDRYLMENNAQCTKSFNNRPYVIENNIQPAKSMNGEYSSGNSLEPVRSMDNGYFKNTISKPESSYWVENNISCEESMDYYNSESIVTKENQFYKPRLDQEKASRSSEWMLPQINAVFSKFSDIYRRELTQPIYVQVSDESERLQQYPLFVAKSIQYNTTMLESLYNFKGQFVVNQPLLKVPSSAETKCVFSTPVVATPKVQPSATVVSREYNNMCERDSQQYMTDIIDPTQRIYDFLRSSEVLRRDAHAELVLSTSNSSPDAGLDSTQELGANVTIPEMVEDALEIISQDGDYMERIGMDVRMPCVLCSWAGPKIIMEYHLRQEHGEAVQGLPQGEGVARYTLGVLARRGEVRVLGVGAHLYELRAAYQDPDQCTVGLAVISSDFDTPKRGKLTAYNKVTGEPYTWQGIIPSLSPTMCYGDEDCLKLEISRLNLLPTSANLKLFNRELVIESPSKVVVGNPELDEIHIVVYVKIYSS